MAKICWTGLNGLHNQLKEEDFRACHILKKTKLEIEILKQNLDYHCDLEIILIVYFLLFVTYIPDKTQMSRQKNSFSGKRGDRRSFKVPMKPKFDSFSMKAGLASFSVASGGSNFLGMSLLPKIGVVNLHVFLLYYAMLSI